MNKSQINRMAKQRQKAEAQPIAQNAAERPQERAAVQAVNLSPETIDALSRELRRALLELGPILARIAAADTIHTVERSPRVFGRALQEAQTAAGVLQEAGVTK